MMRKWEIPMIALLMLAGILTACSDSDSASAPDPVPDAKMALSVSFQVGTKGIGDPGGDHGEWTDNWKKLGVYLVYTTGHVLKFEIDKADFHSPHYFTVYEGTATVYMATFPEGQEPPECSTPEQVYNMKTANITDPSLTDIKQKYMQNLFSGISAQATIEKEKDNKISVTCTRIVSKVDVQWDVQPGIDGNKFVDAKMSAISFTGRPQGYFFATAKTETDVLPDATADIAKLEGNISERNGRTYAYMFPETETEKNSLGFTITYDKDGTPAATQKVTYQATFNNTLEANSWYKVNFTVSGKNVDATGGVTIVIGQQSTQK